jgi:hypothetical protein
MILYDYIAENMNWMGYKLLHFVIFQFITMSNTNVGAGAVVAEAASRYGSGQMLRFRNRNPDYKHYLKTCFNFAFFHFFRAVVNAFGLKCARKAKTALYTVDVKKVFKNTILGIKKSVRYHRFQNINYPKWQNAHKKAIPDKRNFFIIVPCAKILDVLLQ